MKKLLFLLIITLSPILPTFAMKRSAEVIQQQAFQEELVYFIYEDGTDKGIWVKKELVEKCKSLKDMLEDLGETAGVKIPLKAPVYIIKLAFAILDNKVKAEGLSLNDLIDVFNILNFLDAPDAMSSVMNALTHKINGMGDNLIHNEILQKLSPDLLNTLLIKPSIKRLETKYITSTQETIKCPLSQFITAKSNDKGTFVLLKVTNEDDEGQVVIWNMDRPYEDEESHKILDGNIDIDLVEWSADGNRIIYRRDEVDLVVCDITDFNNIKQKVFDRHGTNINWMHLFPDGKKVVVEGRPGENFIVWDISNIDNIPSQKIVNAYKDKYFSHIVWSADGKKFIATHYSVGSNTCTLVLRDISNEDITFHIIVDNLPTAHALAWSSDNNIIAVGVGDPKEDDDKIILYDIHDLTQITHTIVVGHQGYIEKIVFSPNGSRIVSLGPWSAFLWDISNRYDIKKKPLLPMGSFGHIPPLFSSDGRFLLISTGNRVVICDMSDFNYIAPILPNQEAGGSFEPILISEGKKVLIGNTSRAHFTEELTVLHLSLTREENVLFAQIKNYTFKQQLLIYQLCSKAQQFKKFILLKKGTQEYNIFMSLPPEMRQFLDKTLKIVVY